MDLKPISARPSDAERRAVDRALAPLAEGESVFSLQATKARRTYLLPGLLALQAEIGWVSPGGLGYVCERLGVPPAEGWGVATFYALLALNERPRAFAHVCDDIACKMAGADALCAEMQQKHGAPAHSAHRADPHSENHTVADRVHTLPAWSHSPCLGLCDQAPAALVTVAGESPVVQSFGHATVGRIESALRGETVERTPCTLGVLGPRRLLARADTVDPSSLSLYRSHGGYHALDRAFTMGADAVIAEVSNSKLVGRGGAAFPTGRKWEAVARAEAQPHYVVCNADESEPGTFKDRVLVEQDPFCIVEAMTIAGFATRSERGYLYLRGEYPLAHSRLASAIEQARAAGLLGANVMGRGFGFDIELRSGGGAYICGEETALFASVEGFRGEPRSKPPFPVHSGLFAKPTAINNVETLAAVLHIVSDGAQSYKSVGTDGSPGTKLFCVSGSVGRPGVYEVPFGTPLRTVLELAGGLAPGRTLQGILMGGAAGGFVNSTQLDMPLSFEGARAAGSTLGSGVILVLDDTVQLLPLLQRIAEFFRDESCGQCVPCRVGTVRQEELLARLVSGQTLGGVATEKLLFAELGQAMRDASICGLGQTASNAIESALKVFQPFDGVKK
ncbi:MAG: NADH-ubiquinone oxidoreductase-F iron-sulfur binding region domain-containing protein [Planctomycetota bacterium]